MSKWAFALGASLPVLFLCSSSFATSAADKATARELATSGIELFRAGKYDEALDKLKRAEQLYDVPVHLLYIARAQEKLGQLVESAETYRQLDHYTLPEGAPPAWVSAQEDGRKELPQVEPRVPKLKVILEPKDVAEPNLSIDGTKVSSAVVGVERPINPGKHHVEVTANGYTTASADVQIAEKESKDVSLKIERSAGTAGGGAATTGAGAAASQKTSSKSAVGFMAGLRLGPAVPTGKLSTQTPTSTTTINTSDFFQSGAGAELHAGLRIAGYFTPVIFVEWEKYTDGSGKLQLGAPDVTGNVKNPSGTSVGFGLMVGTPPGKMGGFGEFDVALAHSLTATIDQPNGSSCSVSATGPGFRLGGGGTFPLVRWLNLTPFAMITVAKPTKYEPDGCNQVVSGVLRQFASSDFRTHEIIFLGVGGDLILGNDR